MTAARAATQLSAIESFAPETVATATLVVETSGAGFTEITHDVVQFLADMGGRDGALFLFLRHTSASLTIQENADPDVLTDLATALALGTWQGIYLAEHRRRPHRREIVLQFIGDRR